MLIVMVGGSFHVVFTDDHYGTSMPGAGAVHLIKTFGLSSPSHGFRGGSRTTWGLGARFARRVDNIEVGW